MHIRVRNGRCEGLLRRGLLLFRLRISRFCVAAQQHGHGFGIVFAVEFLHEADRAASLVGRMVKPLTAVYRDAVVACQPFFSSGLDELLALPEEKFFEVDGRGALFLFWGKFYVL